jgi:hypothetical protein
MEWLQVDVATISGSDLDPYWPEPVLAADQRLAEQGRESYTCVFSVGGEIYRFTTSDQSIFKRCQPGGQFNLQINSFGDVVSFE